MLWSSRWTPGVARDWQNERTLWRRYLTSTPDTDDRHESQQHIAHLGWSAVDACEEIRALLDGYFGPWGSGYSAELDQRYQALWKRLHPPLRLLPGINERRFPLKALPPSLGLLPQLRERWWQTFGKPSIERFEEQLVMALNHGDCLRAEKADQIRDSQPDSPSTIAGKENKRPKKPNSAARRVKERRRRVSEMIDQGKTQEAMVIELKTTPLKATLRTIQNDVKEIKRRKFTKVASMDT